MTPLGRVFVALWLIMITRCTGVAMGARQCLRIRNRTSDEIVYEWFSALGFGFSLYAVSDVLSVFIGIAFGPSALVYSQRFLWMALILELVQTAGMWVITLVLMNGGAPGFVRKNLFRILTWMRFMRNFDEHATQPPQDPPQPPALAVVLPATELTITTKKEGTMGDKITTEVTGDVVEHHYECPAGHEFSVLTKRDLPRVSHDMDISCLINGCTRQARLKGGNPAEVSKEKSE